MISMSKIYHVLFQIANEFFINPTINRQNLACKTVRYLDCLILGQEKTEAAGTRHNCARFLLPLPFLDFVASPTN
ncbi:hypothetical protein EAI89_22090 [Eubacterium sp. am_0171]|nr:hypothetical protein EAI89_22090 [Eubacterium sp. am_0171]